MPRFTRTEAPMREHPCTYVHEPNLHPDMHEWGPGGALQLGLAAEQGNHEKQREYLWRVADANEKAGRLEVAEAHLKELLGMNLSKEQKLEALCFLADIQVLRGAACHCCA